MIDLRHGDCIEIMKTIPDGSIDCVLTDPPYGTTACKWDSVIPFDLMWEQLKRVTKPNGAIVLFGSEPFSSALRMSNIKNYKYDWYWDKGRGVGHLTAKIKPMKIIENAMLFQAKGYYFPQMRARARPRKSRNNGVTAVYQNKGKTFSGQMLDKKYPIDLITYPNSDKRNRIHPTQKPVALMAYLVRTYTQKGETVLDFTMGSGSTGVACVQEGRAFIGIERDDLYFKAAQERITDAARQGSLF